MRTLILLLLFASSAHAQSVKLTNADLYKRHAVVVPVTAEVLDSFRTRQFHAPATFPPAARSYSTTAHAPSAGPWEWPEERPARRLDGTSLSDPLTIYGERWRARYPERSTLPR